MLFVTFIGVTSLRKCCFIYHDVNKELHNDFARIDTVMMDKFLVNKRKLESADDFDENHHTKKYKQEANDYEALSIKTLIIRPLKWRDLRAENLDCDYGILFSKVNADRILCQCERMLNYNEGQLAKVKIFGKWHDIPRKQVAHGDPGLSYTFSNNTVPARPWTPFLDDIRDAVSDVTGHSFNFVLINRYKNGCDHMGEHRDDEKDLVHGYPIASLSLGQPRDFIFKHADSRGKKAKRSIEPLKLLLEHGSLLLMKHPTNTYWYHALPQRKRLLGVRINMTFRQMVPASNSGNKTTKPKAELP
ncbi:ALKB2-like protein [Mya arenaria]|uniref:ALKB2-like protein n=2 Tax=Mya arenaria TaxID=6604 RepID=A0ABY7E0N8_MYAAR|nr:ALKB2-like protein [Mya arenaria]